MSIVVSTSYGDVQRLVPAVRTAALCAARQLRNRRTGLTLPAGVDAPAAG
jgi:hypothetical protein